MLSKRAQSVSQAKKEMKDVADMSQKVLRWSDDLLLYHDKSLRDFFELSKAQSAYLKALTKFYLQRSS